MMSFHRKKWFSILLIFLLLGLAFVSGRISELGQVPGEYITIKEVRILSRLLNQTGGLKELELPEADQEREWITYGQLTQWLGEDWEAFWGKEEMEERYRRKHYLLKEDWLTIFDYLCHTYDPGGKIEQKELLILAEGEQARDSEGKALEENQLLSDQGVWMSFYPYPKDLLQTKATFITCEGAIWGAAAFAEEAILKNIWLIEKDEDKLTYFYGDFEIAAALDESPEPITEAGKEEREQVADLHFTKGRITKVRVKEERIGGEVLKLSDTEVEIRGEGVFPLDESIQFYRLYDRLRTVDQGAVRIGYNFTDFVIEDGKIQAGLLVKEESMDEIRVLLKATDFAGNHHSHFQAVSEVDMELTAGNERILIPAGETLELTPESPYFDAGRVFLQPVTLTGKIRIPSIQRKNEGQGYRGRLEVERQEEGLLVVNELLLEEYLYAVVPSEMPGYYPMEALKAQTVTARTYAYRKMLTSPLRSLGAHLDDSSTYQVYNNIRENTNTTKAVKETMGLLLKNGSEPVDTFYYSTSCGIGTDETLWKASSSAHLQAREMTLEEEKRDLEQLREEETFRCYIDAVDPSHFESQEGWYRWTYQHTNGERIGENLRNRRERYPEDILVDTDGSGYREQPIPRDFRIEEITVAKRGVGGIVEELVFRGEETKVLVKKELNIRMVLTDGETKVLLQNGNTYACGNLLPSSFFYLDAEEEDGRVTAVSLKGGGFGHGVGMSQNGARNLANLGYDFRDILSFYYESCQVTAAGEAE